MIKVLSWRRYGNKNVTLRNIAKRLGCAHTNLYNYFGSLDEIFWEALAQAMLKMMDNTTIRLNDVTDYFDGKIARKCGSESNIGAIFW